MISEEGSKGDYGPYKQSERKDIYQAYAKSLIQNGLAYPCFCTPEEIEETRQKQEAAKIRPGYYGVWAKCRTLPIDEVEKKNGILVNIPVKTDGADQDQNVIFYNLDETTKLNKYEIVKTNNKKENSIYLSNYTYIHAGLNLGDKFEYELNDIKYSNNVDGVIEEMQYGNYSSSIIVEYLSNDAYNNLLNDNPNNEVVSISIKCKDREKIYNEVSKYLAEKNIKALNKDYDTDSKQKNYQ